MNYFENMNDFENIYSFENLENLENDGKGNEFNNEINTVSKILNFFIGIFFLNQCVMIICYFDNDTRENFQKLYNNIYDYSYDFFYKFLNKLKLELPKKLLTYNGLWSDSDSSSSSDSNSESESDVVEDVVVPEVKYEDKYLDDIKKMSLDYRFSWAEVALRDNKFNELFSAHKINLVNEKYKLNQEIVEKGMEYVEIDDEYSYENINNITDFNMDGDGDGAGGNDEFCNLKRDLEKEQRKKALEDEINLMRDRVKELEEMPEDEIIAELKLEAHNFVIKQRLDSLKNNFIIEKTPLGNVIMYWNNSRGSFEYYSDNTIPYRYLETVGRKYVKTFNCRKIYVDMEFELSESERKQKEKQEEELKLLEEKNKMDLELEQNTRFNSTLGSVKKKDVFAKFKNYNKESGTGKVNRGAAPPKNSIPNNNMKKSDENVVLKENANRYTCEGRIANFSFLKKPDRKVIDKKYAMSFSEFKKTIFMKKV
jgi:hypothetical protein